VALELKQRFTTLLDLEKRNVQGTKLGKKSLLLRPVELISGIDPDARKAKSLNPVVQPSLAAPARTLEQCQGNQGQ